MGFHIRMAGVTAGIAAGIALLAGFFGQVPFGYILLRSLVGAVLFGGFGYGAAILMEKFLPELFEAAEDTGTSLDISVGDEDEDNEIRRSAYTGTESEASASDSEELEEGNSSETPFQPGIEADLIEEVQEHRQEDTDSGTTGSSPVEDGKSAESSASGDSEDAADLDSLPDLEGMTDAFITTEASSEDVETAQGPGGESVEQAKEIAQAIRTVLQREKQG